MIEASIDLAARVSARLRRLVSDVRRDSTEVVEASTALWQVASDGALRVQTTARATPRFVRVVREAATVAACYRLLDLQTALVSPEAAAVERETRHRVTVERLRDLCCELGGGILKIGQLLSTRADILPEALVAPLRALQDRAPAEPWEAVAALLEEELGRPHDQVFASFDPTPIAAASLAQVHRATLPGVDGAEPEVVAVKVQRPGIAAAVESDISAVRVAASMLGDLIHGVDVPTIAREVGASLRAELDFAAEGEALIRFAADFAGDPLIVAPAPHMEFTRERVLTMEFLDGERLTDWLDAADVEARDALLRGLVDATARQVLEYGFLHADPHPGNFLVLPGPRLAVLDFGAVAELSPGEGRAYAELVGALLQKNPAKVARLLAAVGFEAETGELSDLETFAADLMDRFFKPDAWDITKVDPMQQIADGRELVASHPTLHIPPNFVAVGRVLGTLGGLLFTYRPKMDLMRDLLPHVARAVSNRPARG